MTQTKKQNGMIFCFPEDFGRMGINDAFLLAIKDDGSCGFSSMTDKDFEKIILLAKNKKFLNIQSIVEAHSFNANQSVYEAPLNRLLLKEKFNADDYTILNWYGFGMGNDGIAIGEFELNWES